MRYSIGLLMVLFLNICFYSDGKDAKLILEEFKNDYTTIAKACQTIGFVKSTCASQENKRNVAFTAAVTSVSTTWNSGILVFNAVISNVGDGYNPRNGVFTAPMKGTYVFYLSGVEYNKNDLRLDIVLNKVSKVRIMAHPYAPYSTATNMVVLSLKNGDEVWMKHHYGKGYYSNIVPLTTFTGLIGNKSIPHMTLNIVYMK